MQRQSIASPLALMLVAGIVTACHGGAGSPRPEPVAAGRFGDSSALGVRVVALNEARDRATYELAAPAHVVALWVVPGQRLGQIDGAIAPDTAPTPAGIHELPVTAARGSTVIGETRLLDDADYRRCIDANMSTAARQRIARDSSGMIVDAERLGQTPPATAVEAEQRAGRACARIRNQPAATMPTADRFLVLIASSVRLTPHQLRDRVASMAITTTDLPMTMTAIADALYFDRAATWSGYYARW